MSNWIKTLTTYLPYIGGAIGGPAASLAISAGISAFGGDSKLKDGIDPKKLLKELVLGANIDDVSGAKTHDIEFKTKMAEMGIKLEEINVKDRINAREFAKNAGDCWHHVVGMTLVIANIFVLFWILYYGIPDTSSQVVLIILGIMQGWGSGYIVFLYGSSKGSKNKDVQITDLVNKLKE